MGQWKGLATLLMFVKRVRLQWRYYTVQATHTLSQRMPIWLRLAARSQQPATGAWNVSLCTGTAASRMKHLELRHRTLPHSAAADRAVHTAAHSHSIRPLRSLQRRLRLLLRPQRLQRPHQPLPPWLHRVLPAAQR